MTTDTKGKYIPVRKGFPKVYRYQKDGNDYFLVDGRSKTWGLNIRKNFNFKDDALNYAQEIENQILANGKSVSNNQIYQDKEIERLDAKLKPFGKTLGQAVDFYIHHLEQEIKKSIIPPISQLCQKWYEEKTDNNLEPLRNRTSIEYKSYRNYITRNFGLLKPGDITKKRIQDLLKEIAGEQFTKKKYLQYLKNFLNWCVENDYIAANPAKGVKIKIQRTDISIFSPEQVEKTLRSCEEKYPSLLGYFCLCVFGGLRPSEAERVEWKDLNFEGKEVFVAHKSKTGFRRFVLKDTDTLWVWLNHIKTAKLNDPLNPVKSHIGLQTKFRRDLGLPWPQDVLRHSFGTYYYNLTHDLNQVSHDMGNSIAVCKRYYVREVRKEWTNAFWGLRPQTP
jgi:integrase